jgi:5'-phosphate synthase pdxT subunit
MTQSSPPELVTVGVLALQGAFSEHIQLLRAASSSHPYARWTFLEVRTPAELEKCNALIIPGGESTTISLVAERSNLLEPLRDFVKVARNPVWGTCAGLILLSESANRTKRGGQELIGGLDVRVNRNYFGRQAESFEADLDLPFLTEMGDKRPFRSVFIRAPVVEKILPHVDGVQKTEANKEEIIVAPSKAPGSEAAEKSMSAEVEIMGRLPGRARALSENGVLANDLGEEGDIIAVRQGNVFGTSFHPELTGDERIHVWWLGTVLEGVRARQN